MKALRSAVLGVAAVATLALTPAAQLPSDRGALRTETEGVQSQETGKVIASLQRRLPGISPPGQATSAQELAGSYSAETKRLAAIIGGGGFLAGSKLYLFGDGEYIYTEWADVEPETIYGQGTWSVESSMLHLSPQTSARDGDVPRDLRYVLFKLTDAEGEGLRLMGISCAFKAFESFGGANWRLALLMHSLEQVEHYSSAEESRAAREKVIRRVRPGGT